MKINDLAFWRKRPKSPPLPEENREASKTKVSSISPGRVSVPEDQSDFTSTLHGLTQVVTPSFRVEVIQLIRKLYKVNPDMAIAIQETFKLANTGHQVTFPNNTDQEAEKMREHLKEATKRWSTYSAGIDGLVNKMIVQLCVGGAISVEGVPNNNLDGLSTILFLKPDNIRFKRENNGVYQPYQKNDNFMVKNVDYVKLNTETYVYAGMYNDTDEPYGMPPFMSSLDSIKGQHDMMTNFKQIMEQMGFLGFLTAKMQKPDQQANESLKAYESRLNRNLEQLKRNLKDGMKDGLVTGYIDDHEFEMTSTTKDLGSADKLWNLNQQRVANGLGINGNIIGVSGANTEGGMGIILSKMISQLRNIQMIVSYVLEFLYGLELRLAGFDNKGIKITWATSTIADDVKVQQALQYKIANLNALYRDGIIGQSQYAWEMGYDSPDQDEPRVDPEDQAGVKKDNYNPDDPAKKKKDQDNENKSARRTRDKANTSPKRGDQKTNPR